MMYRFILLLITGLLSLLFIYSLSGLALIRSLLRLVKTIVGIVLLLVLVDILECLIARWCVAVITGPTVVATIARGLTSDAHSVHT